MNLKAIVALGMVLFSSCVSAQVHWSATIKYITVKSDGSAYVSLRTPTAPNPGGSIWNCANDIVHLGTKDVPVSPAFLSQALTAHTTQATLRLGVDGSIASAKLIILPSNKPSITAETICCKSLSLKYLRFNSSMHKKIIVVMAILMMVFSVQSQADGQNCVGQVKSIMDYPTKCDGHIAFKLIPTGAQWLCSLSKNSDSMILTAAATGRAVSARLTLPTPGECASITHYTKPNYIAVPY